MESLLEEGISFPGALEFSGTVDEETGGYGEWPTCTSGFQPRVDHVIIPEPLNVDRICLGHRGACGPRLKPTGALLMARCRFWETVPFVIWGRSHNCWRKDCILSWTKSRRRCLWSLKEPERSTLNLQAVHGGEEESYDGMPSPCVPDSSQDGSRQAFLN